MPALSSRLAVRLAAIGAAALVLGAAAYEIPPRMELGAGPNPRELVGTYRVEPATRTEPTARVGFVHLLPDGRVRRQRLHLGASDGGLAVEVRGGDRTTSRWFVRRPSGDGPLAGVFTRPQLCVEFDRMRGKPLCTPFERDPYTGDIAYRLEPTVLHRAPVQRLTRLRIAAMPD